ncbi:hypothetical protein ACFYO5_20215 [Streptomyces sp. NPDC006259]|uniref:hypothetical protein n=1 Tax=Streptomyces sp. NPDC006259 TaxID=3364740 RepID=UPI0036A1D4A9
MAKASLPLVTLKNPADIRRVLDSLKLTLSGATAAAETVRRKRAVLFNPLAYAVELGELPENPFTLVKWKLPTVNKEVDRRVVVNPRQAGELLAAISYVGGYRRARRRPLVALFARMFFGGPRPAKAVALRRQDYTLPDSGWASLILEKRHPLSVASACTYAKTPASAFPLVTGSLGTFCKVPPAGFEPAHTAPEGDLPSDKAAGPRHVRDRADVICPRVVHGSTTLASNTVLSEGACGTARRPVCQRGPRVEARRQLRSRITNSVAVVNVLPLTSTV